MKHTNQQWNDRYADRPVNEQAAELWRQQTAAARPQVWRFAEAAPAGAENARTVRNPWIENLPHRPKKQRRGLVVFLLLLAVTLAAVGVYWAVWGFTDWEGHGFAGDPYYSESLDSEAENIAIPTIVGGDARLTIRRDHGGTLTAQEIFKTVNPAVVTVVAMQEDGSGSIGTGVLFTDDGFFLTNAHVIEGGQSCMVLLSDGRRYEASLVGFDRKRDVAVLKAMDAVDLPVAEIGDSEALTVGDPVYAIGNPLGLELRGTLTDGIVSAIDRDVRVDGRTMSLIQTNAALNKGNSGGPLINQYGQVVGLNTVKMSAGVGQTVIEGLGFAVPSDTVAYLANQILKYGEPLPDTSLGVVVWALRGEAAVVEGLMVDSVTPGSCADKAGIRPGDVIVAADGVETRENADLLAIRREHSPGDKMILSVFNGEETVDVEVILDAAE